MDNLFFLENSAPNKKISVLPIPLNIGSDNSDMDETPGYLLKLGLKTALESAGFEVKILPEISGSKKSLGGERKAKGNVLRDISSIIRNVHAVAKEEVAAGNKLVALGGDHTISLGTIGGAAAALAGDLGVIWIDAHGDLNTHETSLSGNVHGMVASGILGFDKSLADLVPMKIKTENILHIGLKDLDQAEIDLIRREKISTVTMLDILEQGFSVITKHVELLRKKVRAVWISLDMDAIDEQCAPASAMATSGGLSYREITNLLTIIGKTCEVAGIDIAEVTPNKDIHEKTGKLCIELIASAFGSKYNWYSEYIRHYKNK